MKTFVIGGSGFLGQHLTTELLTRGLSVVNCDTVNPPVPSLGPSVVAEYLPIDITDPLAVHSIPMSEGDTVIHLAARQYHGRVPRKNRHAYFQETNVKGTYNLLQTMQQRGVRNMIYFSTDMVYGKPIHLPLDTNHPKDPFGPYGVSKRDSEELCNLYRDRGFNISLFRPRMIIGPGRLGILKKLFLLIEKSLPVPLIGNGKNHYQMISVLDCVSAVTKAMDKDFPNSDYNLGSKNPPAVRELMKNLIRQVQSKSIVVPTPGPLVKAVLSGLSTLGLELLYKEQYKIADENYIVDISKTEKELLWTPQYSDTDMIFEAYSSYRKSVGHPRNQINA